MSVMESPLEVLSRAATMVQDNANEARLTTKELPTTKWRRDRRIRTTEYHHTLSSSSMSPSSSSPHSPALHHHHPSHHSPNATTNGLVRPLSETTQNSIVETPLDMSVTSGIVKPRSPPPPYREPLPGSTFATALAPRPSVITQAPPKRDSNKQIHNSISDRENDDDSADSESNSEIDEHFRRSLGADYMNLFKKKSSPTTDAKQQEQSSPTTTPKELASSDEESSEQHSPKHRTTVTVNGESVGSSVDDHFAKALGDTWKKLQADKARNDE